ncbi:MAG: lipid-A-disaccharide synthase [Rhizobiaceae bacterium]
MKRPLKIALIAGEESGDILGADLVAALREKAAGRDVEIIGVGGKHLAGQGLESLFDPSEIALMGISAILAKLPRLFGLICKTAAHVLAQKPDCLVIIDSPEFTHRVARKVRAADPSIPIINYICPSVWAWRPGRAKAMKAYVDHVLAILPFEPRVLAELGGPAATYVGHRLGQDPKILAAAASQKSLEPKRSAHGRKTILVLPGSRNGEVARHAPVFGETLGILAARGMNFEALLPVTDHLAPLVRSIIKDWPVKPLLIEGADAKFAAFGLADAALAASGTVTLELALSDVPTVACYRLDRLGQFVADHFVSVWSASLPNLIADAPVVPEFYDIYVRPQGLARHIEMLANPGPARAAMLNGFASIRTAMETASPSGELAAEVVLRLARKA